MRVRPKSYRAVSVGACRLPNKIIPLHEVPMSGTNGGEIKLSKTHVSDRLVQLPRPIQNRTASSLGTRTRPTQEPMPIRDNPNSLRRRPEILVGGLDSGQPQKGYNPGRPVYLWLNNSYIWCFTGAFLTKYHLIPRRYEGFHLESSIGNEFRREMFTRPV